ncbi:sulfurtransferase TusA family protein [Hydrogenivirga sp.]
MERVVRLDVRDMEPPQPLLEIAKRLESLEEGQKLEVLGSRPFVNLLPRLEELGFEYSLEETPEGYLLTIERKP